LLVPIITACKVFVVMSRARHEWVPDRQRPNSVLVRFRHRKAAPITGKAVVAGTN